MQQWRDLSFPWCPASSWRIAKGYLHQGRPLIYYTYVTPGWRSLPSGLENAIKELYSALEHFTPAKQVKPEQNYFGGSAIVALTIFAS